MKIKFVCTRWMENLSLQGGWEIFLYKVDGLLFQRVALVAICVAFGFAKLSEPFVTAMGTFAMHTPGPPQKSEISS